MDIRNYGDAKTFLEGGRDKTRRPVAHETDIVRRGPDRIAVRYWRTDVVTYHRDGRTVLRTNGWQTVTTKKRLNDFTPPRVQIYQKDFVWYVRIGSWHGAHKVVEFEEGMEV